MHQMDNDGPRFYAPPNSRSDRPQLRSDHLARGRAPRRVDDARARARPARRRRRRSSPFDYYWPGYEDSVPLGHNTVCLLTEAAGVKVASTIAETNSRCARPDRRAASLAWRPVDGCATSSTTTSARCMDCCAAAAAYRGELVRNFYDMGRRAVDAGSAADRSRSSFRRSSTTSLAVRKLEELLLARRRRDPAHAGTVSR